MTKLAENFNFSVYLHRMDECFKHKTKLFVIIPRTVSVVSCLKLEFNSFEYRKLHEVHLLGWKAPKKNSLT